MARPVSLPYAEHYQQMPCGTRAKYVAVHCRCALCRAANSEYARGRNRLAVEAALEISAPAAPAPQTWTAPDGTKRTRFYKRACPGVNGTPCRFHRHLRKDSKGGVCGDCRLQLVWNGLVSAAAARRHLLNLSRAGVGRRAVSASCDVGDTTLQEIRSGAKTQIRADTERRILGVTPDARGDASVVSGRRAQKRIAALLEEGFTKAEIARRLGLKRPALQFNSERVLARTDVRVERFYQQVMAE